MINRLTPLQRAVADGFFSRERRFVLTGGGALVGFHLGHRETADLDLFTSERVLDEGGRVLREVALSLGASLQARQTSPTFHRYVLRRGDEGVVVDLAWDDSARGSAPMHIGNVVLDGPDEIMANKLCTLLSRAELRDLVDVRALELAGTSIEQALILAQKKDAGLTPGQLAWVLSQIQIGDDARVPGGVSVADLRQFLAALRGRMVATSLPK
ncbi:MAG: nucleotidyl transferase AbiEii/AbiGii toxin family protein [Deltaproteobacteria bacterium]|nr:nucleotidyl transferase AbiEii/AbiGii toxin family protein [Deltaproteobacteria bacterium]